MYSPQKLRELLKAQGRTVNWLAEATEYAPETITRYMNGHQPISQKFAARAALLLGVPVSWLEEDKVAA